MITLKIKNSFRNNSELKDYYIIISPKLLFETEGSLRT
jgi:hypothetical protein